MANLQIRIDDKLKERALEVSNALGMDITTAVRIFLNQMVKEKGLPFKPNMDPFYSVYNQKVISTSIEQLKTNKTISKDLNKLLGID